MFFAKLKRGAWHDPKPVSQSLRNGNLAPLGDSGFHTSHIYIRTILACSSAAGLGHFGWVGTRLFTLMMSLRKDGLLGGGLKLASCALTLDKW